MKKKIDFNSQETIIISVGVGGNTISAPSPNVTTPTVPKIAVIGVCDTGVDYTHKDIYQSIYINQKEIPMGVLDTNNDKIITFADLNNVLNSKFVSDINNNGYIDAGDLINDPRWNDKVDNDKNGYVDDICGWNFVNNNNNPFDNYPTSHGTGTASLIKDSNTLICPIKSLDVQDTPLDILVNGLNYFTNLSIQQAQYAEFVGTNNSWGTNSYYSKLQYAITYATQNDLITICAAGNYASNNDIKSFYPATFLDKNLISVGSVDSFKNISYFSNYGNNSVELFALGESVYSAAVNNSYSYKSGTSFSAPQVSRGFGLISQAMPNFSSDQKISFMAKYGVTKTVNLAPYSIYDGYYNESKLTANIENYQLLTNTISKIYGNSQSNTLIGTNNNDIINAYMPSSSGVTQIDKVTGNLGKDTFVLGNTTGCFYASSGRNDYCNITDLTPEDNIILYGKETDYSFTNNSILYKGDLIATVGINITGDMLFFT